MLLIINVHIILKILLIYRIFLGIRIIKASISLRGTITINRHSVMHGLNRISLFFVSIILLI